ncbi:hypothetical protein Bca4012_085436 [Brassica carinata]
MRISAMSQMQRSFSIDLPSLRLPSRRETHLWYILPDEVKSTSLLKRYSQLLSQTEKDRVDQMRGDELKKNALLARTLSPKASAFLYDKAVKLVSKTNEAVDPRSLMFKKNMYGKPEVSELDWQNCNVQPLHFNISHTDSLIACGVTVHVPVGIDVEDKERKIKHDVLTFAKRFYSADEVNCLATILDPEAQRKEFIKLWTLKEAYVKALGKGFSAAPFNTFTIQSNPGGYNLCKTSEITANPLEETKKCNGGWKFALLELADSHYAAVCTEDDQADEGAPMRVIVRKTIPFVEDQLILKEYFCN